MYGQHSSSVEKAIAGAIASHHEGHAGNGWRYPLVGPSA
jgi:hypothetical protein